MHDKFYAARVDGDVAHLLEPAVPSPLKIARFRIEGLGNANHDDLGPWLRELR